MGPAFFCLRVLSVRERGGGRGLWGAGAGRGLCGSGEGFVREWGGVCAGVGRGFGEGCWSADGG